MDPVEPVEPFGRAISVESSDALAIVTVAGEVDLGTSPELAAALRKLGNQDGGGDVLVDLCAVSFVDSSGLSVLLNSLRRLQRQGRLLGLACPSGPVRRILELTALDQSFIVGESRAAATAEIEAARVRLDAAVS